MAMIPNELHSITFDPGGTIGWTHFVVDCHAFSRPEHKVLANILSWNCGEFTGQEHEAIKKAVGLITRVHYSRPTENPGLFNNSRTQIVSEDFELTQLIGGENLLSPVRINAILGWECSKQGLTFELQRRQMRINITPERLRMFGFESPFRRSGEWTKTGKGKDAFAAMQHQIVKLRRLKLRSIEVPWKLSDGIVHNAVWDCSCAHTKGGRKLRHDLNHPI